MKKKILITLITTMTMMTLITSSIIAFVFNNEFITLQKQHLKEQASLIEKGIAIDGVSYLEQLNDDDYRITYLDANGNVIFDNQSKSTENHLQRNEIQDAIIYGEGSTIRYSDTLGLRTVYHAIQMSDGTIVRLSKSYDTLQLLAIRLLTPLLWIALATIVICMYISYQLAEHIVKIINNVNLDAPLQTHRLKELDSFFYRLHHKNINMNRQIDYYAQQTEQYQQMDAHLNQGILLLNQDHNIICANHAAKQILTPSSLQSPPLKTLINQTFISKPQNQTIELNNRHIHIYSEPIYENGVITGIFMLIDDVTEANAKTQQNMTFNAGFIEQIKQPLQKILHDADNLQQHQLTFDEQESCYTQIHQQSKQALQLIEDIVRLKQIRETDVSKKALLNLADIVHETLPQFEEMMQKRQLQINSDLKESVICAHPQYIREITKQLLKNAMQYAKKNITICTYVFHHNSYLVIQDDGPGIPIQDQPHIFETFFRSQDSHGSGLGLTIVKMALQECQGSIKVRSSAKNGTTMKVRFSSHNNI